MPSSRPLPVLALVAPGLALVVLPAGCMARVDAAPDAAVAPGDANGDGAMDIADPVLVTRHLLAAGPAPVCDAAVDVVPDGLVEIGDALSLLGTLFSPLPYLAPLADGACDAPTRLTAAEPARLAWDIRAEAGGARVTLTTRDLDVDAWSFGVTAEGCSIVDATTTGTVAASRFDGGLRDLGYDNTRVTADGAVSAVFLGWSTPVRLAAQHDPWDVLALTLQAGGDCTCTLSLVDGLVGDGLPVAAVISAAGRSYRPELPSVDVKVCD